MPNQLSLRPRYSYLLLTLILGLHFGAVLFLLLIDWPPLFLLLIAVLLVASTYWQVRHHCLRQSASAIQRLGFDSGGWWLECNDGRHCADLLGDTVVTGFVVILNFRVAMPWRRRSIVLFNDAAESEELRLLRVFLRHQSSAN